MPVLLLMPLHLRSLVATRPQPCPLLLLLRTRYNACCAYKANSIEGCKKKDVDVVYTRWMNLRKSNGMEIGQIGFKDESKVHKVSRCEFLLHLRYATHLD